MIGAALLALAVVAEGALAASALLDAPPVARGGDPSGLWRAGGESVAVYASPGLRAAARDLSVDVRVRGDVELQPEGDFRAGFIVDVALSVTLAGLPLQLAHSDTTREGGPFRVAGDTLVFAGPLQTDSVGFTATGDSLFLVTPVALGAFATFVRAVDPEARLLAVVGLSRLPSGKSADFDVNGRVDFVDFVSFAIAFGTRLGEGAYDARYDLDDNGAIEFVDFLAFARQFG